MVTLEVVNSDQICVGCERRGLKGDYKILGLSTRSFALSELKF